MKVIERLALEDKMTKGQINLESSMNLNHGEKDQQFFGRGKLLLSGEYFVLDGAKSLALPTKVGQSLSVEYSPSFSPKLYWKSFDVNGDLWFEATYEFWHFNCLNENPGEPELFLQKILQQARKQNSHFLRDNVDVHVETKLGFPIEWGLGSSSTLIYNIAQWAYISPFELLFQTHGGSGYDIACAQSDGPILYERTQEGPHWSPTEFNPSFKENLYFLYLGKKQDSRQAVNYYSKKRPYPPELVASLTAITDDMIKAQSIEEFDFLIQAHERIIAENLKLKQVKSEIFSDYWGEMKSLGAWGGDFALVTSKRSSEETEEYFKSKGYNVFIPYEELILCSPEGSKARENEYLH